MNNNAQEPQTLPPRDNHTDMMAAFGQDLPPVEVHHRFSKLESFIAYVRRFKQKNTVIFAQPHYQLKAIIDYHGVGHSAWCAHQLTFNCQHSDAWKAWLQACQTPLSQYEFAAFLAEQALVINQSSALNLPKTVLNYRLPRFSKPHRSQTSDASFQPGEDVLKAPIGLPESLTVKIAPFAGSDVCDLQVQVQYTVKNKELRVWCQLMYGHDVIGAAYQSLLKNLEDNLPDVPVFEASY